MMILCHMTRVLHSHSQSILWLCSSVLVSVVSHSVVLMAGQASVIRRVSYPLPFLMITILFLRDFASGKHRHIITQFAALCLDHSCSTERTKSYLPLSEQTQSFCFCSEMMKKQHLNFSGICACCMHGGECVTACYANAFHCALCAPLTKLIDGT